MICDVQRCVKSIYIKGLCVTHYQQQKRLGYIKTLGSTHDPRPAIIEGNIARIPLGIGAKHGYAIVDVKFSWLDKFNWTIKKYNSVAYAVRRNPDAKGHIKMHWSVNGQKDGYIIDHKNRNGLDNRCGNLRYATRKQNQTNQGINSANKSGYRGVSFRKDIHKWTVRIRAEGKYKSLGAYVDIKEAAHVYNEASLKYNGEFAFLNEIVS